MSKSLKELRDSLAQLQKDAQGIIDQEDMSAEDQDRFDAIMAEVDETAKQIENLQKMANVDRYLNNSPGRRTDPDKPGADVGDGPITGGADRKREDPWLGFEGCHDFVHAVRAGSRKSGGSVDPRLAAIPELMGAPTNFHRETASDEGYMVPPALRDGVLEAIDALDEDIFSDVDAEPTERNAVEFIRDESTPWGATGIQAYWAGEGNQMDPSRLVTKKTHLELHKLYAFVLASSELLEDGPRLFDRLTRKSGMAIVWKGSSAIVEGNGVGQPLGYRNGGSLVSVAKETSQTADTVNANNVAKMFSRCLNPARGIWYINQDVFPQLVTMTLGDQPIFIPPSQGIQSAPGGFLLGRPVKISEHCETLGDEGDIVFANPMQGYYSPRKPGVAFAQSMHLYFDYDVEAFRWTFRMGGSPILESAISPAKGSATRSHFVVLAERT